jgi:DNA polymerase-3 subunit epsilon
MLRELDRIEHRVCRTELEAEVTELRLIQAHAPRHNRRSRPGRTAHWIKLTEEEFPRLSIVRNPRGPGTLLFGPYAGRRGAARVVEALWDAVPIRRCTGRPGRRGAACAPAQLGVAMCPCDGTLDPARYAEMVARIQEAVNHSPDLLLDPLAERVAALAAAHRYEEAGWARDRHGALAAALERRRRWEVLQQAGSLIAGSDGKGSALIEAGRLAAAWEEADRPPLLPTPSAPGPAPPLPLDLADAEEAGLVWRWLTSGEVRLVEALRPFCEPVRPVARLERIEV